MSRRRNIPARTVIAVLGAVMRDAGSAWLQKQVIAENQAVKEKMEG